MAPITINFMLACYCSGDPEGNLGSHHWNSSAGQEARKWLRENNLIKDDNRPTDRGKAWVHFICETPLPVSVWVRPANGTMGECDQPVLALNESAV